MSSTTRPHGVGDCPDCDGRVLFAYGPDGSRAALDPAPGEGPLAVAWDDRWVPTFRPVPDDGQLALGEHLFRLHDPQCPGLATVTPISRAPSLRRRRARPAAERRQAHAR